MGYYPKVKPYRTIKFSAGQSSPIGTTGSTSSLYSSTLAIGSLTFAAGEIAPGSVIRGHCVITGVTSTGGANLIFKYGTSTLYTTTGLSWPSSPLRVYWELQMTGSAADVAEFEVLVCYTYSAGTQQTHYGTTGIVANLTNAGTLSVSVINGSIGGSPSSGLPAYVEHLKPYSG